MHDAKGVWTGKRKYKIKIVIFDEKNWANVCYTLYIKLYINSKNRLNNLTCWIEYINNIQYNNWILFTLGEKIKEYIFKHEHTGKNVALKCTALQVVNISWKKCLQILCYMEVEVAEEGQVKCAMNGIADKHV